MEVYNVKEILFKDGTVDTRIYKHDVFNIHFLERKKKNKEKLEEEIEDNIRRSVSRTIQKIYEVARNETWEWFLTLTFSPDKVDRYNYNQCSKKLSYWLNNIRKRCPDMKYLIVPEMHKDCAWHFHGLLSNIDDLDIVSSGIYDSKGKKIYNLNAYKWGFSTLTAVNNNEAVTKYILKYITKEVSVTAKGKKKYWVSRNVERPCAVYSEVTEEEKCFMWQELLEDCDYSKILYNKFNSVMYFQNK